MDRPFVADLLRNCNGLKLKAYKNSAGETNIGYGRNLDATGIDESEAELLLDNDITRLFKGLTSNIPIFASLDNARQAVLIGMGYNLGIHGLLSFTKMLTAVEKLDFEAAANEMLASKWAEQVGAKAQEWAALLRRGFDQE